MTNPDGGSGPAGPSDARPTRIRLPLAAFRRRIVFHGVFVLLGLAVLALAVVLLAEEKQRARARYEAGFRQTLVELGTQLRHPAGQLALLNPGRRAEAASDGGRVPQLLPFSAIDFDDPFKARQAVEMSGCSVRWPDDDQLCMAVGQSAYAGGFVYVVAQVDAPPAVARERGVLDLGSVSRARITLTGTGMREVWTAPFEGAADGPVQRPDGSLRGRLTGFSGADEVLHPRARPDRDFRGWLWQEADCLAATTGCRPRSLLALRVPVAAWRDALYERRLGAWPPADLGQWRLRLQWLGPSESGGTAPSLQFDSGQPGAQAAFSLQDLQARLAPGERLEITRIGRSGAEPVATLQGSPDDQAAAPWLTRLILRLPYDALTPGAAARQGHVEAGEVIRTPGGTYSVRLSGDLAWVDRGLGATATRLGWFVGAMLGAIALAWLVIEVGFIRRVAVLTQRAAALSRHLQDAQTERQLGELEVADLRGRDELGILAGTLSELLQRVKQSVRREQIRVEQERDMWHAVGHEIMSPLQSLMVLHGKASDPSHRYVQRMQQAVRVLYGTASPSEALQAAALTVERLDLGHFLELVAANAPFAGIDGVRFDSPGTVVAVEADEHSLEDVVTHVLRNADRHRRPGTPITISLRTDATAGAAGGVAEVRIHNQGPAIAPDMIERIFEYGVSDEGRPTSLGASGQTRPDAGREEGDATSRRGQGLFVARTYMAKMGGTIEARNEERDGAAGVSFVLRLALSGPR